MLPLILSIFLTIPAGTPEPEMAGTATSLPANSSPTATDLPADSRMIAAVDQNGRAWVLDAFSGEVIFRVEEAKWEGQIRISGWLAGSKIVVHNLPNGDSGLALVDVSTGEVVRQVRDVPAGYGVAPPVILAQDSPLALVGSDYNGFSGEQIHPYVVWD